MLLAVSLTKFTLELPIKRRCVAEILEALIDILRVLNLLKQPPLRDFNALAVLL